MACESRHFSKCVEHFSVGFFPLFLFLFFAFLLWNTTNQMQNKDVEMYFCTTSLCGVYFSISSNVERFTCFILSAFLFWFTFISAMDFVYRFVCKFNLIWFMRSHGHSGYIFLGFVYNKLFFLFLFCCYDAVGIASFRQPVCLIRFKLNETKKKLLS